MNKRDAINHIRQFGGRLDRFRKSVGGSGDGGRNAPKRAKSSPKPVNRKTNVFNEQVRYAFHGALQDLKSKPFATFLTVMVIAISLTLPTEDFPMEAFQKFGQAGTYGIPYPRRRRSIIRHRKSLFICKKRWTMTLLRAWWHSCRPSKAWRK